MVLGRVQAVQAAALAVRLAAHAPAVGRPDDPVDSQANPAGHLDRGVDCPVGHAPVVGRPDDLVDSQANPAGHLDREVNPPDDPVDSPDDPAAVPPAGHLDREVNPPDDPVGSQAVSKVAGTFQVA